MSIEAAWWLVVGGLMLVLIMPLLLVSGGIIQLGYSDGELTRQALDVYEGSAWSVYVCAVLCCFGAISAVAVRRVTPIPRVATASLGLASMFVACGLGMAAIHYILMRRITDLTGQGFGGFP